MNTLKCKVVVLEGGFPPEKKHPNDACYDLRAREVNQISPWLYEVKLGVALQPQEGYRVALYPRSSISKTGWMLANCVGVGDNNYAGEYMAYFVPVAEPKQITVTTSGPNNEVYYNTTEFQNEHPFPYKVGDRCVQMELVPYHDIEFEQVSVLRSTERGSGGFGSTGKN